MLRKPGRRPSPAFKALALLGGTAMMFLSGCARPSLHPFPNAPEEPSALAGERIVVVGSSVEKRPLRLHLFGQPPYRTFIFAGIHGDEVNAAELGDLLIGYLRAHPDLWRADGVAVMPAANPDGLIRKNRYNANAVDLNRNFPAKNWQKLHRSNTHGAAPASEPETAAIIEVVRQLAPNSAISVHSIHDGRECNNFDGPAGDLAEAMGKLNGYRVSSSIGYPTPGSFGSWAGRDLGYACITLELPREVTGAAGWEQNRDAVVAVIQRCSGIDRRPTSPHVGE